MNIGSRLLSLRKAFHMSQEEVAEKLQVTRQTVSNWELGQTTPDLNQAKSLAALYKVSLDELVGNDSTTLLTEKVSNVETLAGIIIKILKIIGILFIIYLFVFIVGIFLFSTRKTKQIQKISHTIELKCSDKNSDYLITIGNDGHFNCSNCSGSVQKDLTVLIDYADLEQSAKNIEEYFEKKGAACK